MSLPTFRQIRESVVVRPLTMLYVVAVVVIMFVSAKVISTATGVIVLGFVAVLIALAAVLRELRTVHSLVNGQHDAMVDRINQLVDELHRSAVRVPEDPNLKGGGR